MIRRLSPLLLPGLILAATVGCPGGEKTNDTIVPQILTLSPLPNGKAGQAYPPVTLTAFGLNPPLTWTLTVGALPLGLQLSSTGVISGTPQAASPIAASFTIRVTGAGAANATKDFTLGVPTKPKWKAAASIDLSACGAGTAVPDAVAEDVADGRLLAVWTQGGTVRGVLLADDDRRSLLGAAFDIGAGSGPAAAAFSDASQVYLVAWRDGGAVRARLVTSAGAVTGNEIGVAADGAGRPSVTWDEANDRFRVSWTEGGRFVSASGALQ